MANHTTGAQRRNARMDRIFETAKRLQAQYRQFAPGQKVRSVYGETLTVREQNGCQVFVRENQGWFHPSKLYPVE